MSVVIELKNVSFVAQNRYIIRNFSHKFEQGQTTALVGPSGCGKSTVLKLCAGLLVPSEGEVIYRGMNVFTMNRKENLAFRREGAMVFQDSALWANQSLYQILELPLLIHFPDMKPQERKERINTVLKQIGYKRDLSIRPSQLSMGEQKLIAFARAHVCDPDLFFLDEWTESLDDAAATKLIAQARRHQKEGDTIILVTHDFRVVKIMADYIVMIMGGQFFLTFTRQQIQEDQELARFVEGGISI